MGEVFNRLPYETHLLWISFLSPADICKVSQLSSFFNEISQDDDVWKHWCKNHFGFSKKIKIENEDTNMEEGNAEAYKRLFGEFGPYISCYARVNGAWEKIRAWLTINSPGTLAALRPGVSQDEIAALQKYVDLPPEFLCSLRIHDGQTDTRASSYSLFGVATAYDYGVSMRLLQTEEVQDLAGQVRPGWLDNVVPFAASTLDSLLYLIVVKDFKHDKNKFQFKKGMVLDHTVRFGNPVVLANSFMEFLENFATDLHRGRYDTVSHRIIMIPALASDGSDVTTRGVRVRANAIFMPQRSTFMHDDNGNRIEESYFFIYRIRISMKKNESKENSCKLQTRSWRIVNGNNQADVVSGPGVIGLYPKAYPGSFFDYCSCTTQSTLRGFMEGEFTFALNSTGETFQATVGTFALNAR